MERLKILAAASTLGTFTSSQLAAYAGSNENTVRSVLRRDEALFEVSGLDTTTPGPQSRSGRPPRVWRIKDPEAVRELIREQERALPAVPERPYEAQADPDVTTPLIVAERALTRAWETGDAELRAVLLQTARDTVHESRLVGADPAVRRHGDALVVMAELIERVAPTRLATARDLKAMASAVASLAMLAGHERAEPLLRLVVSLAMDRSGLPPLGILTDENVSPSDVLEDVHDTHWSSQSVGDGEAVVMWSQRWAAPLADARLLTGLVLPYRRGQRAMFEASMGTAARLGMTSVVVSADPDRDGLRLAEELGAQFVTSARSGDLGRTLLRSVINPSHEHGPRGMHERENTSHYFRYAPQQAPRRVRWEAERARKVPAPVEVVRVADSREASVVVGRSPEFLRVIPLTDEDIMHGSVSLTRGQ